MDSLLTRKNNDHLILLLLHYFFYKYVNSGKSRNNHKLGIKKRQKKNIIS